MPQSKLEKMYGYEGRRFADALRRLLPKIVEGTHLEQQAAQRELQQIANKTSAGLKAAGQEFIRTEIPKAVTLGGKQAASDIGIEFGGVNHQLITKLSLEAALPLARAAEGVRPFLGKALKQASLAAAQFDDSANRAIPGANLKISESLARGALEQDTAKQATKRLMSDLGLDKGDSVLLMSGRTMDAEAYAEMTVRTREMEGINAGKADQYMEAGVQFIETSEHEVVSGDICEFLQGKVWALGPNSQGIPELPAEYGLPPWHPNCRHTFGAWIPELNGGDSAVSDVVESHSGDAKALEAWDGDTKK